MFTISCHVVGRPKTAPGNLPPYTLNAKKTRVPVFDPRRRVTVGSKTQETLPAHPNGTRPHRTQDAAANRALLREETTTSTSPPKNGRAALHPARDAHRSTLGRSPVTARRAGAAMTPAQLTPNLLPDEDDAETPQDEAPTPKREDEAPAKAIRRAKRA